MHGLIEWRSPAISRSTSWSARACSSEAGALTAFWIGRRCASACLREPGQLLAFRLALLGAGDRGGGIASAAMFPCASQILLTRMQVRVSCSSAKCPVLLGMPWPLPAIMPRAPGKGNHQQELMGLSPY
jgi:hypothetical protein